MHSGWAVDSCWQLSWMMGVHNHGKGGANAFKGGFRGFTFSKGGCSENPLRGCKSSRGFIEKCRGVHIFAYCINKYHLSHQKRLISYEISRFLNFYYIFCVRQ